MEAPILETERLILRPFTGDDVDSMIREILSDPDVMVTLPEAPANHEEQRKMAQTDYIDGYSQLWVTESYGGWAVCSGVDELATPGMLLGFCGFSPSQLGDEDAELAFGYGKAHWGKGIGFEAANASVDWYFQNPNHNCMDVCHYAGNAGSKKIIENLGFKYIEDKDLWGSVEHGRGLMPTYILDRRTYAD
ncbi:MAG: GNAT family N-acetyltransferase [Rhodospirillales bacterium]|nr:GNAT family N-acetyltransferase [Rhodospirillales bacterium]